MIFVCPDDEQWFGNLQPGIEISILKETKGLIVIVYLV